MAYPNDRYWVGSGGSLSGTWDSTSQAHWSYYPGGAGGAPVPTDLNSVYFDQSGPYTVTLANVTLDCLDWNVSGSNITFSGLGSAANLLVYGNLTLAASTTCSFNAGSRIRMYAYATNINIQTNGVSLASTALSFWNTAYPSGGTSTYTLIGDVTAKGISIQSGAVLKLNGYSYNNVNGTGDIIYGSTAIDFGSNGSLIMSGNSAQLSFSSSGGLCSFSGTGTISFTGGGTKTFTGNGVNCTGVTLSLGNSGTTLKVQGSNTFANITNTAQPVTFTFDANSTTTVSDFTVNGTSGNLVTIQSSTAGTKFTLSKSSGTVNASYLTIKDSEATGGAIWNASNSTVSGVTTGWNTNPQAANLLLVF